MGYLFVFLEHEALMAYYFTYYRVLDIEWLVLDFTMYALNIPLLNKI